MRKSKLLCVILSVCMLFSLVSQIAFAEGYASDATAVADKKVARIGEEVTGTYYASLCDAIKAVKDNETITMIADASESQGGANLKTESITFTLDGNGKTLTLTGGNGFSFYDSHVTIKNLKIERHTGAGAMFNVRIKEYNNNGATITLDHCILTVTEKGDLLGRTQVFNGAKDGQGITWNINDCTINAINDAFLVNNTSNESKTEGPKVTYNVNNSTITITGEGVAAVRCFNVDCAIAADLVFNISNNSTIKVVGKSKTPTIRCFHLNRVGTSQVNLASGATLELASESVDCVNSYFISGSADIKVNDNGATWKLSKAAAEQGAYYPQMNNSDDVLGWAIDGKLYKHTNAGKLPTLENVPEEGITIQPGYFDKATDFTMKDGAAVRIEDPTGIRFVTHVSSSLINTIFNVGLEVEFGTYFTLTSKLNMFGGDFKTLLGIYDEGHYPDGGGEWVKVVSTKCAVESTDGSNGGMNDFYLCLYGIPEIGYDAAISAMSYFKVTYADGTTAVFYTEYTKDNNSRSMKDVAEKAIAAGEGNTFLQSIVDACKS